MGNNRQERRAALTERLVKAAEALIAENGLRGLKAREITARAECALGALYTAVEDLDQLIILVNSRTLGRLAQSLRAAVPENAGPQETLHALAQGYGQFAIANPHLWWAIFNHRLPEGAEVPDWHKAEYPVLIAEIIAPLAELRPDLDPETLRIRAQTLFAAVHGVVQLSIHGRYVGTPDVLLAREVEALVDVMIRGIPSIEAT